MMTAQVQVPQIPPLPIRQPAKSQPVTPNLRVPATAAASPVSSYGVSEIGSQDAPSKQVCPGVRDRPRLRQVGSVKDGFTVRRSGRFRELFKGKETARAACTQPDTVSEWNMGGISKF